METCTHPGEREKEREREKRRHSVHITQCLAKNKICTPRSSCKYTNESRTQLCKVSEKLYQHRAFRSNDQPFINTVTEKYTDNCKYPCETCLCVHARAHVCAGVCVHVCVCVWWGGGGGGAVSFLLLIGHVLKQTDIFTAGRVWNQDEHNTAVGYRGRRNYGPFCCSSVSTFKPSLAGKTSAILIYAMSRFIQPPTPTPTPPTPAFVFFSSNTKRCCVSLTANQTSSRDFGVTR